MSAVSCLFERISALTIGVLLSVGAVGATIIGFTVLPVIGLIIAVPLAALAVYFFRVHLNRQCQIQS